MSASSAEENAMSTPMTAPPDLRLSGRWLLAGRIGWVVLTVFIVALNIAMQPDMYASQLTPDLLRHLRQQGVTPLEATIATGVSNNIGTVTCLAIALLLFWRRSDDRMALFGAYMFVTFGGVAANPLDPITGGQPMPQPVAGNAFLTTIVYLLVVIGQVSFVVFFYLFPSGRFVPRWTRWFALLALVYWFAVVFVAPGSGGSLILVFWLVAVIAQIYRYRRASTPVEREQTKWVVYGIALAFLIVLIPSLVPLLVPDIANAAYRSVLGSFLIDNIWIVAIVLIPTCIAIAILRTHLWDIDILINRTLVYGSLTAVLAGVYFACVIGAQTGAAKLTGQTKPQPVIIVASTLVIAAIFNPLRHRFQSAIDRQFYRRKYDAAKTLTAFAVTLRSEVSLGELTDHLAAVVAETMEPAHVSVWLRPLPERTETTTPEPDGSEGGSR